MRFALAAVLAIVWEYVLVFTAGLDTMASALLATLILGTVLGIYIMIRTRDLWY